MSGPDSVSQCKSTRTSTKTPKVSTLKKKDHSSFNPSHQPVKSKRQTRPKNAVPHSKDAFVETVIQPLTTENVGGLPELEVQSESGLSIESKSYIEDPAQDEEVAIDAIRNHTYSKTNEILDAAKDLLNATKVIFVTGKRKEQELADNSPELESQKRTRQAFCSDDAEVLKHSAALLKEFRLATEAHNDGLRIQVMAQIAMHRSIAVMNQSICLHCNYCASKNASDKASQPPFSKPSSQVTSNETPPPANPIKSLRKSSRIARINKANN
ncbi:hypothetical protein BGZ49_004132 [Haplosporangium sp. Z 27]|nr:hypothetical protein BGZ49_004132 [Haplosporangium sp. Z 27]